MRKLGLSTCIISAIFLAACSQEKASCSDDVIETKAIAAVRDFWTQKFNETKGPVGELLSTSSIELNAVTPLIESNENTTCTGMIHARIDSIKRKKLNIDIPDEPMFKLTYTFQLAADKQNYLVKMLSIE